MEWIAGWILSGLNRGLLVGADDPDAPFEQRRRQFPVAPSGDLQRLLPPAENNPTRSGGPSPQGKKPADIRSGARLLCCGSLLIACATCASAVASFRRSSPRPRQSAYRRPPAGRDTPGGFGPGARGPGDCCGWPPSGEAPSARRVKGQRRTSSFGLAFPSHSGW